MSIVSRVTITSQKYFLYLPDSDKTQRKLVNLSQGWGVRGNRRVVGGRWGPFQEETRQRRNKIWSRRVVAARNTQRFREVRSLRKHGDPPSSPCSRRVEIIVLLTSVSLSSERSLGQSQSSLCLPDPQDLKRSLVMGVIFINTRDLTCEFLFLPFNISF